MSPAQHPGNRLMRSAGRQLARTAVAVVTLRVGAAIVGTLVTAVVAALLLTVGAVAWWARVVEPRLFAPRRPPAPPAQLVRSPAPADDARHLAFAQALAVVAARYLAQCEQESLR